MPAPLLLAVAAGSFGSFISGIFTKVAGSVASAFAIASAIAGKEVAFRLAMFALVLLFIPIIWVAFAIILATIPQFSASTELQAAYEYLPNNTSFVISYLISLRIAVYFLRWKLWFITRTSQ